MDNSKLAITLTWEWNADDRRWYIAETEAPDYLGEDELDKLADWGMELEQKLDTLPPAGWRLSAGSR